MSEAKRLSDEQLAILKNNGKTYTLLETRLLEHIAALDAELAAAKAECERLRCVIDNQDTCVLDQYSSRVCRHGTLGCTNRHDE